MYNEYVTLVTKVLRIVLVHTRILNFDSSFVFLIKTRESTISREINTHSFVLHFRVILDQHSQWM